MTDQDGVGTSKKMKTEFRLLSQVDPAIAEHLVEQARSKGVDLLGPNGLLGQITEVLEAGIEIETDNHRGYAKYAGGGSYGRTSRNSLQDHYHTRWPGRDCYPTRASFGASSAASPTGSTPSSSTPSHPKTYRS